jgi:hypothetical protein
MQDGTAEPIVCDVRGQASASFDYECRALTSTATKKGVAGEDYEDNRFDRA